MKIKCVKCKKEEDIGEEDVKLLAHVVKKYNLKPRPGDFTAVLSIIKGNCSDDKKHSFIFHEDFDKEIADIIQEYKNAVTANIVRKENIEKTENFISDINKQIKSLQSNMIELEKKKAHITSEMNAGDILIDNIKMKFEKLTGDENVDIWT